MKRFRLSTAMLLIVIAALCVALVAQQRRAAHREAELRARLHRAELEADLLIERAVVKRGINSWD
jgi:hypothetical protein